MDGIRKVILTIIFSGLVLKINAQTEQIENPTQFLFPQFSNSILKMKGSKDITSMLNYNIVSGKMVFIRNGQVFDLTNPETVDTIFINNKLFVPKGKVFYEVLLKGTIVLYIQHKGNIVDPGMPAAYGGTSQVSSSNYVSRMEMGTSVYNMKLPDNFIVKSEQVYWISLSNNDYSFVNERQFIKIFNGKESEIKKYIKANRTKFENPADIINLVNYCSELMK